MEETRNFSIIFSCGVYRVVEYYVNYEREDMRIESNTHIHVPSDRGQALARNNEKHGWATIEEARAYWERIKADILKDREWRKETIIEKMAV